MAKMAKPMMDVVRFENEDVIATSTKGFRLGGIGTGDHSNNYIYNSDGSNPYQSESGVSRNAHVWEVAGIDGKDGKDPVRLINSGGYEASLTKAWDNDSSQRWNGLYIWDEVAGLFRQ